MTPHPKQPGLACASLILLADIATIAALVWLARMAWRFLA
jgi:hypothetical protein